MKKVIKAISQVFLGIITIAVAWVLYESYIADHTVHYGACGEAVPVSVSFNVSKKGETLSCDFVIEDKGNYTISLLYIHETGKETLYSKALDEMGKGIALGYRLYDSDGKLIVDIASGIKSITTQRNLGYLASIMTTTYSPGKYRLEIKSLNDVPEMRNIKTGVLIAKSRIIK